MNIKIFSLILIHLSLLLPLQAEAANYRIDRQGQHASVHFKASHLGFSYVVGRFNDFEGVFSYDPENPSQSTAAVKINAESVDSNHAERDKHLRGKKFFDAKQYPTITFESTAYHAASGSNLLKGVLTLRGISKEIEIVVNPIGEGKDPWGGFRSGFEGQTSVNAADFGMPEWVGEVIIELIVEGIRQ